MGDDRVKPLFSNDLLPKLAKALGLSDTMQRVIIDVQYNHFAVIYVQEIADERLLSIDWTDVLKDAQVIHVDVPGKT